MTRHEVQVTPEIRFVVGHCDDSRIESSPTGTSLAGPVYVQMYVGGEQTAAMPMLRDPDEVLDWVEEQLDAIGRMPETEEVWEDWVGKISYPLVMEGKDGPNIRAAFPEAFLGK